MSGRSPMLVGHRFLLFCWHEWHEAWGGKKEIPFPAHCTQKAGAPKHVKSLNDSRWLLIGYSVFHPRITGSDGGQASSSKVSTVWLLSGLGDELLGVPEFWTQATVSLLFLEGHCRCCKLMSVPQGSEDQWVSHTHTRPQIPGPLSTGARFPLVAEALRDHSPARTSLPPDLAEHTHWDLASLRNLSPI